MHPNLMRFPAKTTQAPKETKPAKQSQPERKLKPIIAAYLFAATRTLIN